jgi:hypothetical protein
MRARLAILIAGAAALGGCAYGYGDYGPYGGLSVGVGYGSGYGGYYGGYGGYGGCYDPYSASGGYGGYDYYGFPVGGYGYGSCGGSYWGWNNGYYYPGTGYYVYDRYRRPHVWSDSQKRYWTQRRERVLESSKSRDSGARERTVLRENWSGFSKRDRSDSRRQVRENRNARKSDDTRPQ